jgi:TonB family protein
VAVGETGTALDAGSIAPVNDSKSVGDSFVTEAVIVGPSPEVIALVHARLAAVADGCYPAVARRYQQRGTVQLSFCTDASGGAASSKVTVSSGAEVLDAAARGCVVEKASPFPAVAASRCFSVPVRFGAR